MPSAVWVCGGWGKAGDGGNTCPAIDTVIQVSLKNLKGNIAVIFAMWTCKRFL